MSRRRRRTVIRAEQEGQTGGPPPVIRWSWLRGPMWTQHDTTSKWRFLTFLDFQALLEFFIYRRWVWLMVNQSCSQQRTAFWLNRGVWVSEVCQTLGEFCRTSGLFGRRISFFVVIYANRIERQQKKIRQEREDLACHIYEFNHDRLWVKRI